jgi:hypothetical protein
MENGNQHSQQPTTSPRIYVACLASYSSGILHGVWIAADQDPADIYQILRKAPGFSHGDISRLPLQGNSIKRCLEHRSC